MTSRVHGRVGLFVTCLADLAYPGVGAASVRLLERLGIEIIFPQQQGCCGQMHVNSGHAAMAVPMVQSFVDAFADCDFIVSPSGSCVGSIRHQHEMVAALSENEELINKVATMRPKVRELSEFLVYDLGVVDVGATFPYRVAYHPSCHSLRVAEVGRAPYELLSRVRGLELVEQADREGCCGFGGTFSLKNSVTSGAMMADKLDALVSTGAEFVTSLDASCLMHLAGGLTSRRGRWRGTSLRAVHLVEILAGGIEPA